MTFSPDPKPEKKEGCQSPGCAIKLVFSKGLCAYHYSVRQRNRSKGEKLLDEAKAQIKPKTEIQKLRKQADDIFSLFIRLSNCDADGYGKCITCEFRGHFRQMDNGHFIGRQFKATRFDEKNVSMQCKGCNKFGQGMAEQFAIEIDKKHGEGTAKLLKAQSRNTIKEERLLYLSVISEYTQKVYELMNTKNFTL